MDVIMHTFIPTKDLRFNQTSKITTQPPVYLFGLLTALAMLVVASTQTNQRVISPGPTLLNEAGVGTVTLPTPKPSKAEIAAILAARDAHRALSTGATEAPLTPNQ